MVERLLSGRVAPGARPCVAEFPLSDAEAAMAAFDITCSSSVSAFPLLFEQGLGAGFRNLASAVQDLHRVLDLRHWRGRAEVTRGETLLARLVAWLMRFPPAGGDVSVTVAMERRGAREYWTRDFAGCRFRSVLSPAAQGGVHERFGLLRFHIGLTPGPGGSLLYPVVSGRIFGLPLPRGVLPESLAREFVDAAGRANFDVALSLRLTGLIVRYRGWLEEA